MATESMHATTTLPIFRATARPVKTVLNAFEFMANLVSAFGGINSLDALEQKCDTASLEPCRYTASGHITITLSKEAMLSDLTRRPEALDHLAHRPNARFVSFHRQHVPFVKAMLHGKAAVAPFRDGGLHHHRVVKSGRH